MPLQAIQATMEGEVAAVVALYENLAMTRTFSSAADFSLSDECLLEGLLSRIWQSWNRFCREVLIESCLGSQDLTGTIVGIPNVTTVGAVSNAAIRVKKSQKTVWTGSNSILRFEPTWGDVNVLFDIADKLNPANAAKLKSACTLAGPGAKILQVIRNATAHLNNQTMIDLMRLSPAYNTFPITHPCQALFWGETSSKEFLFLQAVEALGDAAISCVL